VSKGKELLEEHAELLSVIEKKYKVDKEAIVSLWGVETLYGKVTGNYNVIDALATLGYDKRRRRFFEKELISALQIVRKGHVEKEEFLGSWAGATGQCQFMPSSFILHAQDGDGDGKKDIWTNKKDIFASIANYLKKHGWKKGKKIGELAYKKGSLKRIPANRIRSPYQYNKLGFRKMDGTKLSGRWKRRYESIPHKNSPVVLRGSNYMTLKRWNNSSLFAALNIILMEEFKK
jgi:membrane-bound lytic murein transglycosylase B